VRLGIETLYCPTAVQEVADVHATPCSELPRDAVGFGVGCTAQAVPFHTSASVTPRNVLSL
jgi:hypothetical protein